MAYSSHFADEIWPSAKPLHCIIGGKLEGFIRSDKLFVMENDPFPPVLGFQMLTHPLVCGDFLGESGHVFVPLGRETAHAVRAPEDSPLSAISSR